MKIVITDHRFPDVAQERRAAEAIGATLVDAQTTNEQELCNVCRDADGILTARAPLNKRVIDSMEHCKIIVRYGIGVDTVDIPAATARGIYVANVPDYCVDEVSDQALTLLLMVSRQMIASMAVARQDKWILTNFPQLHRLRGQVCGLVGCGKIGSLLAGKVKQLGMHVVIYDPYLSQTRAREMGAEIVSLDDLLAKADFISLHAPLTSETHHLIGEAALAKMKQTATIINTSRGGLVDEAALVRALDAGKIFGAGLDVLESETAVTPVRAALVNHPKAVVTAHTAWLSVEARAQLQLSAAQQVVACLKGEIPYGLINRELSKNKPRH